MALSDDILLFSEIPRTEAAFEEHLILKAFLLKSMNAFAPVFYVAFFKGRLVMTTHVHSTVKFYITPFWSMTCALE